MRGPVSIKRLFGSNPVHRPSRVRFPLMVSGTAADATGLRTDHYELTMLAAARRSGVAGRRAVFEVFSRALPPGRRFGGPGCTGPSASTAAVPPTQDTMIRPDAGRPFHPDHLIGADARCPGCKVTYGGIRHSNVVD